MLIKQLLYSVALGIFFSQTILLEITASRYPWIQLIVPDTVMEMTVPVALGQPLPAEWPIPILAVAGISALFVLIAILRFKRAEF